MREPGARMPDHRAAGAAAEGLTAGTRIAVRWDHGWEDGLVTAVRIDSRSKLRTYTITYDDGETHEDELRQQADWRYLDAPPSAQLPAGQPGVTRKRRSSGGLPLALALALALALHPQPKRKPSASPYSHPKPLNPAPHTSQESSRARPRPRRRWRTGWGWG